MDRETFPVTEAWYALRVRSNFERTVSAGLRCRGYEEFLPVYRSWRRWSDRYREIEVPLFSGYVFCRFPAAMRSPVLAVPGVVEIVGFGRQIEPVSNTEIEALRQFVSSGLQLCPWPYFEVGQKVLIQKGPLAGIEGTLVAIRNQWRVVVSVDLLKRAVAAEVDIDWLDRTARRPAAVAIPDVEAAYGS